MAWRHDDWQPTADHVYTSAWYSYATVRLPLLIISDHVYTSAWYSYTMVRLPLSIIADHVYTSAWYSYTMVRLLLSIISLTAATTREHSLHTSERRWRFTNLLWNSSSQRYHMRKKSAWSQQRKCRKPGTTQLLVIDLHSSRLSTLACFEY